MARSTMAARAVRTIEVGQLLERPQYQASLPSGEWVVYRPATWRWLTASGGWSALAEEAKRYPSQVEAARAREAVREDAVRRGCYVVEARRG